VAADHRLLHETRVRQTFSNPYDEPIEATYVFPLPDTARR